MRRRAKTKKPLNVTVDQKIKERAFAEAEKKNIPISRVIENFLEFFADPQVYCYKCGEKFHSTESKTCPKCGWMICPKCNICRCGMNEETAIAVFHMRKVYEDLLSGRVKQE